MLDPMFTAAPSLGLYQVIAAAQTGKHSEKRQSYGDTLIIDPWGTIVGRLPGENSLIPHFRTSSVIYLSTIMDNETILLNNRTSHLERFSLSMCFA